jgi:glycogen phosphorylase
MGAHIAEAAPIVAVTNGVHAPTWQSPAIRAAGGDPERLWEAHREHKRALVEAIAGRVGARLEPESLLIGFARRATAYKRTDLVLRDEARLAGLLAAHPVNFVFAGKAHPDDPIGRGIVTRVVQASRRHPGRIVFLENYDMELARLLTRGCDVWLNNPTRPLEASGTSGMKAGLNGVLNLSILDGWWPEACRDGVNGWAIGDASSGDDQRDLEALYAALEGGVLPAWSDRARWTGMMRASISTVEQGFTSDRMVRDYFEKLYSTAAPETTRPVPVG